MYCIVPEVQRRFRSATIAQNERGQPPSPSSRAFPAQADQAGVGHGMANGLFLRCSAGFGGVYELTLDVAYSAAEF